jgi:GNAT superfamily N-acetyltransferase
MTGSTDPRAVAAAAHWFVALGHAQERVPGLATFTVTPSTPDHWDGNNASLIETADAAALLAALDARMGHTPWRVVRTHALEPPRIEAELVLRGFELYGTVIQMVATAAPEGLKRVAHRPVETDADWALLAPMVREDAEEGGDRHGALPSEVIDAIIASYRGKAPAVRFHLIEREGAAIGYGSVAVAPNGIGIVEHLFVQPAWRGRGMMSGFVAEAVAAVLADGCPAAMLGARAGERPRQLYARLGFRPVLLTRTWVMEVVE